MIRASLLSRAEAWIADDPDPADRAELRALLDQHGPSAEAELSDRFAGRLRFGTAGLRGVMAAGPNRMNRAVVRSATAAVAGWLSRHDPGAPRLGVVIGCDARHRSADFAEEAAGVLAAAGFRVHMLPPRQPTPLLAFAVRHLGAAAGIMITASHNPPQDNGYKLYLSDGAQIIPPVDAEIETAIDALAPLSQIPVAAPGDPRVTRHGDEVAQAYLDAVLAASPTRSVSRPPGAVPSPGRAAEAVSPGPGGPESPHAPAKPADAAPLRVVYTPLHGVAAGLTLRAIELAGFPAPHLVASQAAPDPDFPTVAFPNPEEPGALDLALAEARRVDADLVIANDPDGDRLAVAAPDPRAPGGWRLLTGDQVGALLGAYLLEHAAPESAQPVVASTVVSSTLLSKIAAAAHVRYAETLTGFKWIVRAADKTPGSRFVFGYEEALGYAVGDVVRDKDGISAALAMLSLVATARACGDSLFGRWDALERAHGVHLTAPLTLPTHSPGTVMARLRANPPAELAGLPVTATADLAVSSARTDGTAGRSGGLPPSDVLIYWLPAARVVIRPSGTEPKLKAYLEAVEPTAHRPLAASRAAAAALLEPLRAAVAALVAG